MEPVRERCWVLREAGQDRCAPEELCAALAVSPLTAQVLVQRGVGNVEEGRAFLRPSLASLPDPLLLPDMERAVARLIRAIEGQELIVVHGDYDVDGITGTALLVETLRAFGARVDYHIPLRLQDGYGLSGAALQRAAAAGAGVVLTVDCGISAVAEASVAAAAGLDLIITDHHQPPDSLPLAHALVNPHLAESRFPFAELAGVGVAFLLLVALRQSLREGGAFSRRPEPDLRHALDLVALGTIADIVPLQGVNRLLTRFGLGVLNQAARPGVEALRRVAGVERITCGTVGFRLAPRLNAAGRLEDATLGVELLLAADPGQTREKAELLDGFNRERQQIEQQTLQQAVARLEEKGEGGEWSVVLADERWHPGVIGIVASRLVERYYRPTVLIALEEGRGRGSARSIPGFHLYRELAGCASFLEGFGGHAFAAGLSLQTGELESFAAAFEARSRERFSAQRPQPRVAHDGEVLLEELTPAVVEELAGLHPFGAGNPEPAFVARGVRVQQLQELAGGHLRFTARQDGYSQGCIAFGMAPRRQELAGEVDLLFNPSLNTWRGRTEVQLRIKDWRPTERTGSADTIPG